MCGNTRFLWNMLLRINSYHYAWHKKSLPIKELHTRALILKDIHPFLNISSAPSLQRVCKELKRAISDVFKVGRGFPKYKKRTAHDSFYLTNQDMTYKDKSLAIDKKKINNIVNRKAKVHNFCFISMFGLE